MASVLKLPRPRARAHTHRRAPRNPSGVYFRVACFTASQRRPAFPGPLELLADEYLGPVSSDEPATHKQSRARKKEKKIIKLPG